MVTPRRNRNDQPQVGDEMPPLDQPHPGHHPGAPPPPQQAPATAGGGWGLPIPPGANMPVPNPQMPQPPAGAMPPLPAFPGQYNAPHQQPQGLQQQQIWAAQQANALAAARPLQMQPQQVLPAGGMPAVAAAATAHQQAQAATAAAAGPNNGSAPQGFVSQLFVCPQCHKGLKSQAGLTSHLQHCKPEKVHAELMRNPQEKALRISTKRREKWELRYAELVEYKRKHRHCKVPANDPENLQLGRWVSATRREYKKRQNGQKNQLTDERVLKLHSLGFEFDVHTTSWEQKYEELCDYRERHGHCNVPASYNENQPLAIWVKRQREAHYKRFRNGMKAGMTDERIAALQKIGFSFAEYNPIPRGKQMSWDDRIQQLQAYKDKHGHCNVPRDAKSTEEEQSLGNWVALCRNNYTRKVKTMTEERRKQLEDMGFVWRMKGRDMTPEERAQRKKERAEIELRRKVNREVRKRKLDLVPAEDAKKKAPKKKVKTTTNTKKPAATAKSTKGKGKTKGGAKATDAGATKPPRTYFGHVPKPAEDGGPPPLPELPPGGWDTSDRKTRIEAARRAADYYSRMAQKWEEIAQEEQDAESDELAEAAGEANLSELGEAEVELEEAEAKEGSSGEKNEYGSASEGYAADESEAVEAI